MFMADIRCRLESLNHCAFTPELEERSIRLSSEDIEWRAISSTVTETTYRSSTGASVPAIDHLFQSMPHGDRCVWTQVKQHVLCRH